jgi:hypothetical protein
LAWLGTPKAIETLNRELTSKRDGVRKAVETALETVRNAGTGRVARRDDLDDDPPADAPAAAQEAKP